MSGTKILNDAAEALAYVAECQIATLEWIRSLKRTPKSELRRQEDICRTALANCKFYVHPEEAHRANAGRVEDFLRGKRTETGERMEEA